MMNLLRGTRKDIERRLRSKRDEKKQNLSRANDCEINLKATNLFLKRFYRKNSLFPVWRSKIEISKFCEELW